ncbi:MAG: 16S rRNA (cytosine(1402)-N(4))-methyltransferase RsmH, partial [Spirochaetota bacterium]|nr:16S rRNA (cytosine(1402)-N(4))-methyltransferase RsmH [Spirochaetota bacterium]
DIEGVDFILCDLGISMFHYKESMRGFSFDDNDSLDMRLDKDIPITASDIVNSYDEISIRKILYAYGEESRARQIARNIVRERNNHTIESASHLQKIIREALPPRKHGDRTNPATKTFQALRIYVNQELDHIESGLTACIGRLNPGGRLGVISFHSLEDRLVKRVFRHFSSACICPPEFPVCQCSGYPVIKSLTKKPIEPNNREKDNNPSSRSAKLRVVEKLYETKKDTWQGLESTFQKAREVSRSSHLPGDSTYHKPGIIHGMAKH